MGWPRGRKRGGRLSGRRSISNRMAQWEGVTVEPSIEDEIALVSSPVDEIQVEEVVNTDDQDEDDEDEEEEELAEEDTPRKRRGRQPTKRARGRPRGRGRGRVTLTMREESPPIAPDDSPVSPEDEDEEEEVEEEVSPSPRTLTPGYRRKTQGHKRWKHARSNERVHPFSSLTQTCGHSHLRFQGKPAND
jgi:hypothetical protein